jgi:hypothetical protein
MSSAQNGHFFNGGPKFASVAPALETRVCPSELAFGNTVRHCPRMTTVLRRLIVGGVRPRLEISKFAKEWWRRRPDLNRGWRFCRPPSVLFLMSMTVRFSRKHLPAKEIASMARRMKRVSRWLKPSAVRSRRALASLSFPSHAIQKLLSENERVAIEGVEPDVDRALRWTGFISVPHWI